MRKPRSIALLAALLLLGGCQNPFDDSCGPESRETVIRGEIRDAAGAPLGAAAISLVEIRGDEQPLRLFPIVMGPSSGSAGAPLKGHVTRARLVDATSGAVLHELSVAPGVGDEVLRTTPLPITDEAAFDALKRRFASSTVALELETDLPGIARLRTPLPLAASTDWSRASCS